PEGVAVIRVRAWALCDRRGLRQPQRAPGAPFSQTLLRRHPLVIETHYDYIIVGAGSAGCVLAARLTEDPQIRVLLVEAGPQDRSWRIDMPSAVGSLLSSDRFNWNYVSDPAPDFGGRPLTHPRRRG